MIKWLWHRLVQGHDWRIIKISRSHYKLYVLLECQKCHRPKTVKSSWGYYKMSCDNKPQPIGIDDFLNKIQGKK